MKVIIGCGSRKGRFATEAWRLYEGSYFKAGITWARSVVPLSQIYILSAKYGLISSHQVVAPYNARMGTKTQVATIQQAKEQAQRLGLFDPLCISVGAPYRKFLENVLPAAKYLLDYADLPAKGMGYQTRWYGTNHKRLPTELLSYFSQ